jgi:hypothetical protein
MPYRGTPMQHYWGAKEIAKRLDCSEATVFTWKRTYGLPAYLRIDPRNKFRRLLYSNEALILLWELARSRDYTERLTHGQPQTPQRVLRPSSMQIHRHMTSMVEQGNIPKVAGKDAKGVRP